MNKFVAVAALAIGLTACAGPYHDRYRDNYGDRAEFDVYYDGYYGPYSGGYWDNDGYFRYSDGRGGYRRDDERHFHREQFEHGSGYRSEHHR